MKLRGVLPESFLSKLSSADRKKLGKAGLTKGDCEKIAEVKNERDLQRLIVSYLRLKGIEPLWFRTDRRTTANVGWPDITFAVAIPWEWEGEKWTEQIPCVWEIKFEKGKLRPEQTALASKLQTTPNGWRHRVITSLDQARRELEELGIATTGGG